jgi:LysR family transcriptional regulator, hypochlorite-specific transcription factor HypT
MRVHPANALFFCFDALKAPMLNLIWIEDFLVLAATGNFSRAAEERHTTQPAFSRRIRGLEEWLGTDLFDRSTQPAKLTEVGEWFRGVAEDLIQRTQRLQGDARIVAEASSVTLRIAATHALSFTFLPGWLRALETQGTLGPVQLVSDVLQRCEALMLQSKVQFVLGHAHPKAPGALDVAPFLSRQVGKDRLIPVSSRNKRGKPVHSLDGPSAALLSYTEESGLGRIVRAVVGGRIESAQIRTVFTAHLASVLRTMALDGRGMAWLPATLVDEDIAMGRLVPAAGDDWTIPLQIRLYRDPRPASKTAEAFWNAKAN